MKIAFASDNGTTISRHFGRSRHFVVVTIEDGQAVARELRSKLEYFRKHPVDESADPHETMLVIIADCQTVVAGGMGMGMDQRVRAAGIEPIRTPVREIDQALSLFLAGQLQDSIDLLL